MGNNIGYTDNQGNRRSERLGTNGAAEALVGLFAVAYAAGRFPEAARARRAVTPAGGAANANSGDDIPFRVSKAADAAKLLALRGDDCFWVKFQADCAISGAFSKPTQCPVYEGILLPLILLRTCGGGTVIPAGGSVKKVAVAWRAVLPLLSESCVLDRLTLMTEYAERAASEGVALYLG